MLEREPDFEDEKVRAWAVGPEDPGGGEFEGESTLLTLDMEREEIYESRAYRFRAGPEALAYLSDLVASRRRELGLSAEQARATVWWSLWRGSSSSSWPSGGRRTV